MSKSSFDLKRFNKVLAVCSTLLKRFRSKDNFLLRLVTVDETWFHYYEPENKAKSCQWVWPGSAEAKEVQDTTICWQGDGHSILGGKTHYYVREYGMVGRESQ